MTQNSVFNPQSAPLLSSLTGRAPMSAPFPDARQVDMSKQILMQANMRDPGWLESMSIQTNFPYNAAVYDRIRNIQEMSDESLRIANQEVDAFLFEYGNFFSALYEKWWENINFYHHFHWTPKDIKKIKEAGLQPYISPHMWRWIMTLVGEQRLTKTAWSPQPKSPESRDYAELADGILSAFSDVNDWPRTNSQVFIDGTVGCIGFAMVSPDPLDPTGNIVIERVPAYQFMWSREAINGSLDKARIVARGYWYDTEQLIARYPMWRERLMNYNPTAYYRDHHFIFRIHEPKVQSLISDQQAPVYLPNRFMSRSGKGSFVLEFYRRRPKHVFRVTDANYMIDFDFDNLPQAGEFYMNISQAYRAKSLRDTGQDTDPLIVEPREAYAQVTDQEIWCGNILLDKQEAMGWDQVPYESYAPTFQDGMLTGFFEGEKSYERMRDRVMIYLDMVAGSAKPKTAINIARLPKDLRNNLQEVKRIMARQNEILFVDDRSPDADVGRVVTQTAVPNNGPIADQLLRFLDSGSSHNLGGVAYTGSPDYAGQSGVSQQASMQAAQTGTALLFDELQTFERRVGEKILIASQHLSPKIILSTTDDNGDARFFRIQDHGLQSTHGLKFKCEVTEVQAGPSKRARQLSQLMAFLQNGGPELQAAALPEVFALSEVEVTRIDRIMQNWQQQQQQQADQQAQENKQAEMQMLMRWQDMKAHRENERLKLMIAAQPPIQKTLQMKANVGPGMVAEAANQSGIQADTAGVVSDMAAGALVQQNIDDVAQQHYNDLQIEFERQLAKINPPQPKQGKGTGAGRPKGSGGPLSAKDRSSRRKKSSV